MKSLIPLANRASKTSGDGCHDPSSFEQLVDENYSEATKQNAFKSYAYLFVSLIPTVGNNLFSHS